MRKTIYGVTCALLVSFGAFAQDQQPKGSTNILDKTGIELKLFNAHQDYLKGDYNVALTEYKQANIAKPNDASILFHMGQCYLALNDADNAVLNLEKAENIDPNGGDELHLNLGQAYLQTDIVDKALKELQMYKQKYSDDPKQLKESEVDYYIGQCNNAAKFEAHPVKVTITNMGIAVNSEYDDKTPILTNDGKTMIFTSSRPSMSSGRTKEGEAPIVFDNIYSSEWDSTSNKWGLSYMMQGDINEPYAQNAATGVSADGIYLFMFKNNGQDATGGDIFIAKKTHSGAYGSPVTLGHPVNTSYYEDGATLSPDGGTLYFMSEKPGGFGQADIYKSDKLGKSEWSEPVNLGGTINTPYDDGSPCVAPDGKTIFFSSQGHNSMGGYDIFKSTMSDSGKWGTAVNLGYPINSVSNDKSFTISIDAKTGYFASDRKGGMGGRDIYMVDLSQYPLLAADSASNKPKGLSILRGTVSTQKGKGIEGAKIIVTDSAGVKITLQTSGEGKYYITLKGNASYKVRADAKGYKPSTQNIKLPSSSVGTYSMEQNFELEKE
ncbi:MAG TPA: carboxypeptidase regulatory-like domain-containing protein [Bacteroidia bacterium]|nr:carboxypeptidase regulatory-like domain-containing protein [Bacteroidia bacterium]